jgi:hypothetical protein
VHEALNAPTRAAMTVWRRADHLPIQPTRLYYEISLRWVFWYIGVPAVVLGMLGAALLARRCLRDYGDPEGRPATPAARG